MAQRRGGLGRGLDALIQSRGQAEAGAQEIEIDAIEPNPYQPRAALDADELEALAASIREHGVLQPLIVTRSSEGAPYRIVAGERRWRAARLAGLRAVPAIIRESSPRDLLELALVENVQRADLSVLEEASAYRQLIEEFGLTQAEVAARVGKSRVAVTNALRVLDAPDEIKQAVASGQITEGHARALLGLPTAMEQIAALQVVITRDLSVRQTEQLVREWHAGGARARRERPSLSPSLQRLEDALRRALGTKVELQRGRRGGRLVIHYFSEEELAGIYERIVGPGDDLE
ncbi:MAG: ParB/RepB/Spo0J family partition protein [Thermomicrobiaceae bacterium]|nr:ParB/RepB/Spo0J family partition protein [Thermomicrobiaceae bacterium]